MSTRRIRYKLALPALYLVIALGGWDFARLPPVGLVITAITRCSSLPAYWLLRRYCGLSERRLTDAATGRGEFLGKQANSREGARTRAAEAIRCLLTIQSPRRRWRGAPAELSARGFWLFSG